MIKYLLVLLIFYTQLSFGAVTASAIFEIGASGDSVNNPGVFDPGVASPGTDYSQQNNAQFTGTDLASSNANTNPCVVTSASHNFVSTDNGNGISIGTVATNFSVGRYIIVSTAGSAATLDRACGTAASASGGVYREGGRNPLGNATAGLTDDSYFEMGVAGNIYYVKNSTPTPGAVSIAAAGSASKPIKIIGYNSTRGDGPTGSTRPTFNMAANGFTLGANWEVYNMIFTGTAANVLVITSSGKIIQSKVTNTSTTAGRGALANASGGQNILIYQNELVSYRGVGFNGNTSSVQTQFIGNYLHDSDVGINDSSTSGSSIYAFNIFEGMVTTAFKTTDVKVGGLMLWGNTFYGAENKLGTAVNLITGTTNFRMINNILYGFVTGVTHADVQTVGYDDFNNYSNITTDVTNWTKGPHDIALNPGFSNLTQITGATATTSGSVLTQSGANFPVFVPGQDFLYLKSGTGVTAGVYGITGNTATTITLDIAPGTNATADKVFQVTTGHNFGVSPTMKAVGAMHAFPVGLTTSYTDIGAVQRREYGRPIR